MTQLFSTLPLATPLITTWLLCYFSLKMPKWEKVIALDSLHLMHRGPHQGCCPLNRLLLWGILPILNPVNSSKDAKLGWPYVLVCPRQSHFIPVILVSLLAMLSFSKVFSLYYNLYCFSMQNHIEPKHEICQLENTCRRTSTDIHPNHLSGSVGYCLSKGQSIKLLDYGTHSYQ